MESTAINTVYVVMHVFKKFYGSWEDEAKASHGYLWEVYQREDEAKKSCKKLNEKCSRDDKFVIIEKRLL